MLYEHLIRSTFNHASTNTTAIEELNDYRDTLHNKHDIDMFDDDLFTYAMDNFICPQCGGDTHLNSHEEAREYLGQEIYEDVSDFLKCKECDWYYNLDN